MPTEPLFTKRPLSLYDRENNTFMMIRELIKEFPEYASHCDYCKDLAIMFKMNFSQELVELETLLNILYNYKKLREETKLRVLK